MKSKDIKKLRREARAESKKRKAETRQTAAVAAAIGIIVAAIVTVVVVSMPHYVKLKSSDGKYYDKKNRITYLAAPINYEPVSVTPNAYAKIDGKYFAYPLTGKDTSEWLAEDYYGIYSLYYSEEIHLPSLDEMAPDEMIVCRDGAESVVGVASVTDKTHLDTILGTLKNGERVTIPDDAECTVYTLRFTSKEYSWLYYDVVYVITADGCYYYDRGLDVSVAADGTLVPYLNGNELPDE